MIKKILYKVSDKVLHIIFLAILMASVLLCCKVIIQPKYEHYTHTLRDKAHTEALIETGVSLPKALKDAAEDLSKLSQLDARTSFKGDHESVLELLQQQAISNHIHLLDLSDKEGTLPDDIHFNEYKIEVSGEYQAIFDYLKGIHTKAPWLVLQRFKVNKQAREDTTKLLAQLEWVRYEDKPSEH